MKILQINTSIKTGSTGRIASSLEFVLQNYGYNSVIAYGRKNQSSTPIGIKIGNQIDFYNHVLKTRVFDRHGFASKRATRIFIDKIKKINPNVIHLHNLHGYYLNIEILFQYLKYAGKPVVWTFHDCWPFTGHCSYYTSVNCTKWELKCFECPLMKHYPRSWIIDNSTKNYLDKKNIFTSLENMILISPSNWLATQLQKSFLKMYPIKVINNGVDTEIFKPQNSQNVITKYNLTGSQFILGVANKWDPRKGLADFIELSSILNRKVKIILVGVSSSQAKTIPQNIKIIPRTDSIYELAELYSVADVFVNPTYVDNFPTTNIEALSCGTPVITYNTGGSPESVANNCGLVVSKGDILGLSNAIKNVLMRGKEVYTNDCRTRALHYYNQNERFTDYIRLYESLC